MMKERSEKKVEDCCVESRLLWEWYASVVMVRCARKEWPWNKQRVRFDKLMVEDGCVNTGDEALVLQIIEMKGKIFMELRELKKAGKELDEKKGRDGVGMVGRIDIFKKKRKLVVDVREKDGGTDDKFGWYKYIQQLELKKKKNTGSRAKGIPLTVYETMEMDFD